jgi:hypothetical protein
MLKPFLDELSTFALSLSEGEHKLFSPPFHWVCLANGDADYDKLVLASFKQTNQVGCKSARLVKNSWILKTNGVEQGNMYRNHMGWLLCRRDPS